MSDKTIFLKPKEGLTVRKPKSMMPLNKDGELVALNSYWLRRLKVGDAVKVEGEKPKKAKILKKQTKRKYEKGENS